MIDHPRRRDARCVGAGGKIAAGNAVTVIPDSPKG